jgi:hypothetical protein
MALRVAQGAGPEFKLQNRKKEKEKENQMKKKKKLVQK